MGFILTLQTFWLNVKKYAAVVAIVAAFALTIAFKLNSDIEINALKKQLEDNEKKHEIELKKIQDIHDADIVTHDKELQSVEDKLTQIQKQYDAAQLQLDADKKKEITQIIQQYQGDPDGLAKKLSDATGIPITLH